MPFCLQSQVTNVKPLNRTSNVVEGTTNGRTQGLFGIDIACHPATSSSMSQHQKKQETGGFLNVCANEITAHRPQSSSVAETVRFPSVIPRGRNQVQAEPQQQLQVVTPQRRNDAVVMNVAGLSNWKSSDSSCPNSSFGIISNQQAGLQYWFGQGSQEQATDPLRWMNSSGRNSNQSNIANVSNNNLERSMPSIIHAPKLENHKIGAAQAWMSIGAPSEWKPVDGVCNKQVGSISFNSSWKTSTPVSRVHEDSKLKLESVQGVNEASHVQNKGLVIFPQLLTTDQSRSRSSWQGLVQHNKQKDQLPPDLNISFQPPESPAQPSPRIHIDSQHPDLALQL
ncbi:uncharacterized protein M6B38_129225 [Iris pallida]|uniref:Uncharacterized protein n=1 Tax=Iris pallida TaxID=29817 RepID=A0AAX6G668_IRIPA|nr:uncharacterized protein M6B38_129225 [Iris pallida]